MHLLRKSCTLYVVFLCSMHFSQYMRGFGTGREGDVVTPTQPQGLNMWIFKPSSLSRGRGIYLLDNLADVVYSQPSVIQRYIANPLLFRGHKFDLRLYVLVTSFNPLEVFIYQVCFLVMFPEHDRFYVASSKCPSHIQDCDCDCIHLMSQIATACLSEYSHHAWDVCIKHVAALQL